MDDHMDWETDSGVTPYPYHDYYIPGGWPSVDPPSPFPRKRVREAEEDCEPFIRLTAKRKQRNSLFSRSNLQQSSLPCSAQEQQFRAIRETKSIALARANVQLSNSSRDRAQAQRTINHYEQQQRNRQKSSKQRHVTFGDTDISIFCKHDTEEIHEAEEHDKVAVGKSAESPIETINKSTVTPLPSPPMSTLEEQRRAQKKRGDSFRQLRRFPRTTCLNPRIQKLREQQAQNAKSPGLRASHTVKKRTSLKELMQVLRPIKFENNDVLVEAVNRKDYQEQKREQGSSEGESQLKQSSEQSNKDTTSGGQERAMLKTTNTTWKPSRWRFPPRTLNKDPVTVPDSPEVWTTVVDPAEFEPPPIGERIYPHTQNEVLPSLKDGKPSHPLPVPTNSCIELSAQPLHKIEATETPTPDAVLHQSNDTTEQEIASPSVAAVVIQEYKPTDEIRSSETVAEEVQTPMQDHTASVPEVNVHVLAESKNNDDDDKLTETGIANLTITESTTPSRDTPKAYHHSGELLRRLTRAQLKKRKLLEEALNQYEIVPLTDEWDHRVKRAVRQGAGKYRPSDFARVVPDYSGNVHQDNWLNDEVINGYLDLVVAQGKQNDRPNQTPTYHAFNSFFYTNLSTRGIESVARWSKKPKINGLSLLNVEHVFIPINQSGHWTLAVVAPKKKTITHYNSMFSTRLGVEACNHIKAWVANELGNQFVEADWSLVARGESPQQTNSDDCGVFTVTSARQIMLGFTPASYRADQMKVQRKRIVAELVNGGLLKSKTNDDET